MLVLTTPQINLLKSLPRYVISHYRPAIRLVEMGLAEWRTTVSQPRLHRTEAGENWLKENPQCPVPQRVDAQGVRPGPTNGS